MSKTPTKWKAIQDPDGTFYVVTKGRQRASGLETVEEIRRVVRRYDRGASFTVEYSDGEVESFKS